MYPSDRLAPPAWCDASSIRAIDHLRMVAALSPLIDSSISKTVNLSPQASIDELELLLKSAWKMGLKGLSVFRPATATEHVLCAYSRASPLGRKDSA